MDVKRIMDVTRIIDVRRIINMTRVMDISRLIGMPRIMETMATTERFEVNRHAKDNENDGNIIDESYANDASDTRRANDLQENRRSSCSAMTPAR